MSDTQAVQKTEEKQVATTQPRTIKGLLEGEEFKRQVALSLPDHLKPERFIRIALTAINRTPLLKECDQTSFFQSLLDLSQLGLEPDGRRAHLIPFRNNKKGIIECQLIIDYKGLVDLVMRGGNVSNIHADVVCENDQFVYDRGEVVQHKINFREDRGEMYAAYAICTFKDGTKKAECLSKTEIDKIRKRSRAKDSGPWVTDYNEMAKKTAFRRCSKWLQLTPEVRDALDRDDDAIDVKATPINRNAAPKTLDEFMAAEEQKKGAE